MPSLDYTPGNVLQYANGSNVWNTWVSVGTNSITANNLWYVWNAETVTATMQPIWQQWVSTATGTTTTPTLYVDVSTSNTWTAPVPGTPEQVEERRLRYEAQERERQNAIERAEALLRDNLDAEQVDEYGRQRHFHVTSRSGKRYRITRGRSGNVLELGPEDKAVARYCIHPSEYVPDEDTMLAQKLLLETDEDAFVRIANRTRMAS